MSPTSTTSPTSLDAAIFRIQFEELTGRGLQLKQPLPGPVFPNRNYILWAILLQECFSPDVASLIRGEGDKNFILGEALSIHLSPEPEVLYALVWGLPFLAVEHHWEAHPKAWFVRPRELFATNSKQSLDRLEISTRTVLRSLKIHTICYEGGSPNDQSAHG